MMGYVLYDVFKNLETAFDLATPKLYKPTASIKYEKNFLPIGNTRPDFLGGTITIPFKDQLFPRMFIVSPTGKGKSTLASTIIVQAYLNGIIPIILHDYRKEYKELIMEAAKFFSAERFFEDEIITFLPYFIKKLNLEISYGDSTPFQFDFDESRSLDDINTFLGFTTKDTDIMSNMIETIYANLSNEEKNIQRISEILRSSVNFKVYTEGMGGKSTQLGILGRVNRLMRNNVLGNRYKIDFRELLAAYKIINICTLGENDSSLPYVQTYISIIVKKIKSFIMRNKVKILNVVDEAEKIVPAIANPSSKKEIDDSVRRTRTWNESWLFITQLVGNFDKDTIRNCDYFFVNPLTDKNDIIYLFDNLNIEEEKRFYIIYELLPKMRNFVENHPKNFIPWLKISRIGECQPFFPYVRI